MKTATLFCLISLVALPAWAAAPINFKNIASTNVVKTNDLLLIDSDLGGGSYATRAIPIALLPSGGDTIWTNNLGIIQQLSPLPVSILAGSATTLDIQTQYGCTPLLSLGGGVLNDTNYTIVGIVATQSGTIGGIGLQINLNPDTNSPPNITSGPMDGIAVYNDVPVVTSGTNFDLSFPEGTIGVLGNGGPQSGTLTNGLAVGVYGYANGSPKIDIGIAGYSASAFPNQSVVGVAGSGLSAVAGTVTGAYFETRNATGNPSLESATLLLDNTTTGVPLIVGRTNNGTTVFQVLANGSITNAALTGTPTINGTNIVVHPTQLALAHTGNVSLDFTTFWTECDFTGCTGAVTFVTTNLNAGHKYVVFGRNTNSVNVTPTFPSWRWATGGGPPPVITAYKSFVLSLSCRSASDTNVFAAYGEEQ